MAHTHHGVKSKSMPKNPLALDEISSADFAGSLNKVLTLSIGDENLETTLVACTERENATGYDAKRVAFHLIFKAEEDETHPLLQAPFGTFTIGGLDGGDFGPVMINKIMRPVDQGPGVYLQACFN